MPKQSKTKPIKQAKKKRKILNTVKPNAPLVPEKPTRKTIQARIVADIKAIKRAWASGKSDLEIRQSMGLSFPQWKTRMNVMRSVPPDDDSVISYRRYYHEYNKYVNRLHFRLEEFREIYDIAMEVIKYSRKNKTTGQMEVLTRRRDLGLATNVQRAMSEIDSRLIEAEHKLIDMKRMLGIIEVSGGEGDDSDTFGMFSPGTISHAWEYRRTGVLPPGVSMNGHEKIQYSKDVTEAEVSK